MEWSRGKAFSLALLVAVAGPSEGATASVVTDNPAGWALTFSDEFSGSTLDTTKWGYRQLGPRHDAINTTNAVSVADGALTIKTYTEGGVHYTGMLGTQGTFEQTFGYFEARMKFHTTPGQWSAFWLQSPAYGGVGNPALYGTEIDIVEHRAQNRNGVDLRSRYNSAIHWDGYEEAHQQTARPHTGLTGLSNDTWHTYGLKWSESGYEFYYDDQLIWTVTDAVSERDEYIILSSEVRNENWAGIVPAGGYGSLLSTITNMQVDYVRVYSAVTPAAESADFDADGDVDGADFLTWQRGVGTTVGADRAAGNANAGVDGDVDVGDLAVWRQQVAAGGPAAATVPEPAAWVIAVSAVLLRFWGARASWIRGQRRTIAASRA